MPQLTSQPTRCVVQVTAQVYEQPRHVFEGDAQPAAHTAEPRLTAALGTMWAHAVNTRLVLEYFANLFQNPDASS